MIPFETIQQYINLGWVVIPISKGTKKPPYNFKWKEYQTRKPTLEEYKEWFEGKDVGVALLTGKLSGVIIVDLDSYKNNASQLVFNTPLKVRSGKGGLHGYFRYQEGIRNTVNGEMSVDVRGEGGYVVLPPTIHPNGQQYEWLYDETLPLDTIVKNLPALDESLIENFVKKSSSNRPLDITEFINIEEGSRNDSLHRLSCSLLNRFSKEEAWNVMWNINKTYKPPLEEKELQTLFSSALEFIKKNPKKSDRSWPAPLNERAFYGLAGEFVNTIRPHTEADPAALLLNFLIAFGSIVGSEPNFKVEADIHPLRLFGVLVGRTAKGRKGTSWKYIEKLFGEIDEVWKHNISSGLSSGEGLIWAVRDEIHKTKAIKHKGITTYEQVVEDQGISDKRLLVVESEFASTLRVLGREGNTLSAIIRNAWDTGNLQSLTKNSLAKATNAHISVIGHITKDELLRYLTNTEAGNGFGNRFIWFCTERSQCLPFGGRLPETDFALLIEKVRSSVNFAKQSEEIRWAEETKPIWEKIYSAISEGKFGMAGVMTSRAEAIVTRIACIYALLDKSTLIRPEHLLAAIAVWDYADSSVNYIFKNKIGDPIAEKILEALVVHQFGMSRTEISNYFSNNLSSELISTALETLEGLDRAKKQIVSTGGRSEERWYAINKKS